VQACRPQVHSEAHARPSHQAVPSRCAPSVCGSPSCVVASLILPAGFRKPRGCYFEEAESRESRKGAIAGPYGFFLICPTVDVFLPHWISCAPFSFFGGLLCLCLCTSVALRVLQSAAGNSSHVGRRTTTRIRRRTGQGAGAHATGRGRNNDRGRATPRPRPFFPAAWPSPLGRTGNSSNAAQTKSCSRQALSMLLHRLRCSCRAIAAHWARWTSSPI